MSHTGSEATAPRKKRGKLIAGIILAIVLLLGIGGCAYIASIGAAWNNGTEKFSGSEFPSDDGNAAKVDEFTKKVQADKEALSKDATVTNDAGKNNATENDKNGNGIADSVENGKVTERPAETGATDILLLGSDSRAGSAEAATVSGQRADTIMLLHVPKDGSDAYLISIMRDTWVNIPGYGSAKINAGLNYGGLDLQVATIEQLLGTRIDHIAEIDFAGFKGLTDELGGVTVQVPMNFQTDDYTFTQGPMHLNGDQALQFVRQRYQFSDGDYQRVRNQRIYMNGLLETIKSKGAFENATQFKSMVETISPYVTVDSGLSAGEIAKIAAPYIGSGGVNLHMMTLPNAGTGWSADGQSIVVLDQAATSDLSQSLTNGTMSDYISRYGED